MLRTHHDGLMLHPHQGRLILRTHPPAREGRYPTPTTEG